MTPDIQKQNWSNDKGNTHLSVFGNQRLAKYGKGTLRNGKMYYPKRFNDTGLDDLFTGDVEDTDVKNQNYEDREFVGDAKPSWNADKKREKRRKESLINTVGGASRDMADLNKDFNDEDDEDDEDNFSNEDDFESDIERKHREREEAKQKKLDDERKAKEHESKLAKDKNQKGNKEAEKYAKLNKIKDLDGEIDPDDEDDFWK